MDTSLVLMVMGADRPGLVEALSQAIADHGGNWLESRMAHLAGKFTGILRVRVPPERSEALLRSLAELEARGLKVVAEPGAGPPETYRPVELELVGNDHPGIVRDIATVLARRRVNVEELTTECTEAPLTGQSLFRARARLHLPAGVSVDELRTDLENVAHDLMVDLTLGETAERT